MNEKEKELFIRWLIENVDAVVMPRHGGDRLELFYNLIHAVRDGKDFKRYAHEKEQDDELVSLGVIKSRTLDDSERAALAKEIIEKYPDAVHLIGRPSDTVLDVQNLKISHKTEEE